MFYADETSADALEAWSLDRADADAEMAHWRAEANAADRARARGVCQHSSTVGYAGKVYYPEQTDLRPGMHACTEHTGGCVAVWETEADMYAAQDAAHPAR
jgi:hypothetical protein